MLAEIQSLLNDLANAAVSVTRASGAGRAYELLLMTSIASELDDRGYTVQLLRSDGTVQTPTMGPVTFIQRGGAPSGIRSASQGPNGPSSIVFQRSSQEPEWEMWNGVQFLGRSGSRHEFDISVVPRRLGDRLRNHQRGGRPFGHGWLALECKDMAADGTPDEMRTLLARIYDTTLLNWHANYIGATAPLRKIYPRSPLRNGFGQASATYRMENQRVFHGIVRRTGFSSGTAQMSAYYYIRRFDNVSSYSPELDRFVAEVCDWLDQNLPATL